MGWGSREPAACGGALGLLSGFLFLLQMPQKLGTRFSPIFTLSGGGGRQEYRALVEVNPCSATEESGQFSPLFRGCQEGECRSVLVREAPGCVSALGLTQSDPCFQKVHYSVLRVWEAPRETPRGPTQPFPARDGPGGSHLTS